MGNTKWRRDKYPDFMLNAVFAPALIAALLFAGGCASTRLTSQWSDPDRTEAPLQSVLVVGVFNNERDRRLFEDMFVQGFTEKGVRAFASVELIPVGTPLTKEAVLEATRTHNIETIFVTVFIKEEKESVYRPGSYSTRYAVPRSYYRFGSYYHNTYHRVYQPGYYTTLKSVKLENNLYEAPSEQLIWSAASETFDYSKSQDVIESLYKAVVKDLDKQQLLPK